MYLCCSFVLIYISVVPFAPFLYSSQMLFVCIFVIILLLVSFIYLLCILCASHIWLRIRICISKIDYLFDSEFWILISDVRVLFGLGNGGKVIEFSLFCIKSKCFHLIYYIYVCISYNMYFYKVNNIRYYSIAVLFATVV